MTTTCPACGAANDDGDWRCSECGKDLVGIDDDDSGGAAPPLVADGGQTVDGTDRSGVHAYCHDCDWFATPDDHEYADVLAAAEAHTTFEFGHMTTVGSSDEVVAKARDRSVDTVSDRDEPVTDGGWNASGEGPTGPSASERHPDPERFDHDDAIAARREGEQVDQGACPHVEPGELPCSSCFVGGDDGD
ncbi:hypothetical protein [Halovenus marina]|uniref:hypothetical protein n=1 Tax=Halovenus marina TaxID=3396621 RepID=UPI003F548CD7